MGFEKFIELFMSPEVQSIVTAVTAVEFVGGSIKKLKEKYDKRSHEFQLIDCLEKALLETQSSLKWGEDSQAIEETFFGSLFTLRETFNKDDLASIFKNAVEHDVTEDEINVWIENFLKQLSLKEHEELREFLKLHYLLDSDNNRQQYPAGYIITPNAPRWIDNDIICISKNSLSEVMNKVYQKVTVKLEKETTTPTKAMELAREYKRFLDDMSN